MSSSNKIGDLDLDDISEIDITLMTLRKPTDLKKVIDSIPKPVRAVPKNGLPMWYRLGLESKLPVPTMPKGRIIFSRGRIGEDVSRGLFEMKGINVRCKHLEPPRRRSLILNVCHANSDALSFKDARMGII